MEKNLAERISETPRIKLIVSDVKTLPQSMLLSSKQMFDHVQCVLRCMQWGPLFSPRKKSCLQEDHGKLKETAFMGKGFYHVTMMPETNICEIVESIPLIWHNVRAYVFNWDVDFDMCKVDACIGYPIVVTAFFLGLPK